MGWGWVWVCGEVSYACTHAHACMHAHMHMHVKHDKHGCLHVGGHLQFLYMYTCAFKHVHACTWMCMCVGTPPMPPDTLPIHLLPPQSHREPKTPKFNKSWTYWDNSILFEDSLPLNIPELIQTIIDHPIHPPPTCPTPRAKETQIGRITIQVGNG